MRHRSDLLGEPGTNGQHSFYQLIPGGRLIVRFHRVRRDAQPARPAHDAPCQRVRTGRRGLRQDTREVRGEDRPSGWFRIGRSEPAVNTILLPRLTPALGSWSLYSMVFTQGVVWRVDSFDQWGVELGRCWRESSRSSGAARSPLNSSSTNTLIRRYRRVRTAREKTTLNVVSLLKSWSCSLE